MNTFISSFRLAAVLLCMLGTFAGCQSTDHEGTQVTNYYYGVGYQDPWYHGDYHDDRDVIVTPPPPDNRPDNDLRPTHPIATPPQVSRPSAQPRPSIPSTPRPASLGGGGRRR